MSDLLVALNAVLVVFSMIALGYGTRRLLKFKKETVSQFNRLVFYAMLPIMLFSNVYTADFENLLRPAYGVFMIASILIGVALSWIVVRIIEKDPSKRGVMVQGAFRSNYIILGIPLMQQLYPGDDLILVSALIAIIAPTYNILSIVILELSRGEKVKAGQFVASILKSPLIIGLMLGFLVRALHITLPVFIAQSVKQVAGATSAIALIVLGAQFEIRLLKDQVKQLTFIILARLFVIPGLVFAAAWLMGIRGMEFAILIPVFASPIAVGSYNLAAELGGDADLAANAVAMTTIVSILSLVIWIYTFKSAGMF